MPRNHAQKSWPPVSHSTGAAAGWCGWLLAAALAVLAASGCSGGAANPPGAEPEPSTVVEPAPPTEPPAATSAPDAITAEVTTTTAEVTTTTEPSREWVLLAGGDVLMTRTEPQGIDPFAELAPSLASADLAVVNVEMAISDRGSPHDKRFAFRAPPSAAERIASAGVDVANLANNHAKDYGSDALLDTIEGLEAAGVVTVGAGPGARSAYRHRIVRAGVAVRVAFVGTSMIVPLNFTAGDGTAGIASARQRERVHDSVRVAASEADVVVVTVHWGIERDTCPSSGQRDFARELLDAGADAVIGHHPHVLQPVEFIDGKLVAYSLGNFIWHVRTDHTGETGVLQIDFDGDEITGWSFHPHLLDSAGVPSPVASGKRHDRIRDIIAGNCAPHDAPPPPYTTTTTTTTTTTSLPDSGDPAGDPGDPSDPSHTADDADHEGDTAVDAGDSE